MCIRDSPPKFLGGGEGFSDRFLGKIDTSVVENSYSGVLRSVLRSGESAFFYSGEGDRSGELKGPGECLRSTPGISRHNIVFSCKNTVF